MLLIVWFGVLQKTINISQSFQDGAWESKVLPCRNVAKGVICASWTLRGFDERAFYRLNQRIIPIRISESEFLCRNIYIGLICTSRKPWKKNLFNRRASIWQFQSVTDTQLAKRARSEVRYLEFNWVFLFDGMMEWQNLLQRGMNEVSQKWNCIEIRKWFIMNKKNWRKHRLIIIGA